MTDRVDRACALVVLLLLQVQSHAQVTPLDQPLQEESEQVITCELVEAPNPREIPVFSGSAEAEKARGTYHYKLWLPKGYLANPTRHWPCMFIASAGGDAKMGDMSDALKNDGYVVAMLVESRNGPWEPIIGNFLAAHDDLIKRVRIQEGLKFATGMSGGARASSVFVQIRPGFSGLIMQAAGAAADDKTKHYLVSELQRNRALLTAMTMGKSDQNHSEIARMKSVLTGKELFVLEFDGGHEWAPPEIFARVLEWMERQIYIEGPTRPELRPAYVQHFENEMEKWRAASAPWERYKRADAVITFARARNLAMESAVAGPLRELQAELTALRKDPDVAREALAAEALQRLETARSRMPVDRFAADARDLAKKYPGTEAAAKAKEFAGAQ